MKIVFLSTVLGSHGGGAEVATELLINGLKTAGHSVFVISIKKPVVASAGFVKLDYVNAIPTKFLVPGSDLTDYIIATSIVEKLKQIKPDIVHTIDSFVLPSVVKANKKLDLPCVVTCHQSILEHSENLESMYERAIDLLFKARNKMYLQSLKSVDAVIAVSDFIKKELLIAGVNANKVQTIHNIPSKTINYTFAKKLDTPNTVIGMFASGRMVKGKGFDILLQAMALITKEEGHVKLVIAGDGPEMLKLRRIVNTLSLEPFVLFTGWSSREKMMQFYADSDIVLLPSVYPEACPMVSIEAMSFGKPLVASNIGGIPEAVVNGVNGFLVAPGNADELAKAVLKLVRDPFMRGQMGHAGREILDKWFNQKEIIAKTIDLYEKAIVQSHTE